jgi:Family of unknown function (DUF6011)
MNINLPHNERLSDEFAPKVSQIRPGIYTVVYPNGEHRTLRVKEAKRMARVGQETGPLIVGFLSGCDNESDYTYFGFLRDDNGVNFWRSFASGQAPERLARIRKAVATIAGDQKAAGLAYALNSSRCCRCNRTLTVPASIHNGMGPECAGRE